MDVTRPRRGATTSVVVLLLALALAACGADQATPTSPGGSPVTTASLGAALTDLSVIGCAADDPADEGELTGAWQGNDTGVYYIRQVGECVWWFGTEVDQIEPGRTGHPGFANVASGRIVGTQIDLEWADIPLGTTVNGGGLTFVYDAAEETLTLTEQRGGRQSFGGTVLSRIEPDATSSASPSVTPSP